MKITRSEAQTAKGPAGWFTGGVYIDARGRRVTDEEYAAQPAS